MKSWLPIPKGSGFSLANIPFGIISTPNHAVHRPAVAVGEYVLDISVFASQGGMANLTEFPKEKMGVFSEHTLNSFASLGRPVHRLVRNYLRDVFRDDTPHPEVLKTNEALKKAALIPLSEVELHLPLTIGDYTDFFAGRNHAHNVGTLFRGAANALQPNYNHVPVAYHGRSSSVVVSGTSLHRPWGQALSAPTSATPTFRPSARLDFELEMGMFLGRSNDLGKPIPINEAEDYIFGFVLMNDWSARDIQQWEYVPLGPFNAKNFGTSISPWVVLADALEPFKSAGLLKEAELQSYLRETKEKTFHDVNLELSIKTTNGASATISRTSSKNLLWSWPQMIAHHTVSGCNLQVGDLLGSGTISGFDSGTYGSMLEHSRGGKTPVLIGDHEERVFINDGDTVVIRGWAANADGEVVGFGECSGQIFAPIPWN